MADLDDLRRRALALAEHSPWTDERISQISLMLGVLHELTRYEELGGLPALPAAEASTELIACARGLEAGTTPDRWRSGFHFNNACHRLRVLAEGLKWLIKLKKKKIIRPDRSPAWTKVRDDDNAFKHHGALPLKKGRWECTATDLCDRAEEVVDHFEKEIATSPAPDR